MNKTILLVEDELSLLNIVKAYFEKEGYQVLAAEDGLKALELFQLHEVDIAVVDVLLPHINGFDVVKAIRQQSNIPLVMMTALSSEENQLKGYGLKIDEYIAKPCSPSVLVAKVNTILGRYQAQIKSTKGSNYEIGILKINIDQRTLIVNNHKVELSKTEFDLLAYMLKNQKVVIDRNTFLDEVWGMDVYVEDRIVDTFIKTLRKKLGPASVYIKTIRGIGYKFEVSA